MTNYNERLDEVLFCLTDQSAWDLMGITQEQANELSRQLDHDRAEAKQAITSLTKELVAEAKPHKRLPDDSPTADEDLVNYGYNEAIDQFEQNLSKALEEVWALRSKHKSESY